MNDPFPIVPVQSTPGSFEKEVYNYTLTIEPLNLTAGSAKLWLKDAVGAVVDMWTEGEMNQTVLIPNGSSYLLLTKGTDHSAIGQSAELANEVITRGPGMWLLVDLSDKWHLKEPECTAPIGFGNLARDKKYYELDIEDSVTLTLSINTRGGVLKKSLPNIYATLTNPWALGLQPKLEKDRVNYLENLSLLFTAVNFHKGITAVRVHRTNAGLLCEEPMVTFVLYVGCPCTKRLVSLYPTTLPPEVFLGSSNDQAAQQRVVILETNYRPPSKLGVDIPTSELIYNSDPSQSMPKNRYTVSKRSGNYGICKGKPNREKCGCTDEMKLVYLPQYSDCVERVYMLPHPGQLDLRLFFEELGKPSIPLEDRYIVTVNELNERMPLIAERSVSEFLKLLRNDSNNRIAQIYYGANDTELTMNGSGIYHIEVKLAPKQSFCSLSSYILVFVGQTPIAYPLNYVTNYTTIILLGWVLLGLYVRFLTTFRDNKIHRSGSRCQKNAMVNELGKHHHLVK